MISPTPIRNGTLHHSPELPTRGFNSRIVYIFTELDFFFFFDIYSPPCNCSHSFKPLVISSLMFAINTIKPSTRVLSKLKWIMRNRPRANVLYFSFYDILFTACTDKYTVIVIAVLYMHSVDCISNELSYKFDSGDGTIIQL